MKRCLNVILVAGIVFSGTVKAVDTQLALKCVIPAVAVLGGACLFYQYYEKSNVRLMTRAVKANASLLASYGDAISCYENELRGLRESSSYEDLLCVFAIKRLGINRYSTGKSFESYQKELIALCEEFESLIKKMEYRYNYDSSLKKDSVLYEAMNSLIKASREVYNKLSDLMAFLVSHQDYFKSLEKQMILSRCYMNELHDAFLCNFFAEEENISKENELRDSLVLSVIEKETQKSRDSVQYPLISYVNKITSDISSLKSLVASTSDYPQLHNVVKDLLTKLEYIRTAIKGDASYLIELKNYANNQSYKDADVSYLIELRNDVNKQSYKENVRIERELSQMAKFEQKA